MKLKALLICLLVYLLAFGCAVLVCINFLQLNQWFMILLGHLTATLVVFVASSIYKNSSFYDPFWSVAPIPIALYISIYPESEIINAEKIMVTGKKEDKKSYFRHTGYAGGVKTVTLSHMRRTFPERIIENAVKGMLPHNKLGRRMLRHLKVYSGPNHPHTAQSPKVLEI